jgi:NADH-quinone oxidoreductase subunit F
MESLEGKRGIPRIKPPFPAVVGLYGGPTVINNAETIATVPTSSPWAARLMRPVGSERNGGTRLFGLSGHVERPGVYELPMGYNLKQDDLRSRRRHPRRPRVEGRRPRRLVDSGSAAQRNRHRHGLRPGRQSRLHARLRRRSGHRRPDLHRRIRPPHHQLLQHESCGWCIPCREGTDWLKKSLTRFHAGFGTKDIDNIQYLAENMMGRTFCPLGDAAAMPTIGFVKKFRKEFEDHLDGKPCPFAKHGRRLPQVRQKPESPRMP